MAKQANRIMIGGFVVIAIMLLAVSIVIFGSGKFFKKTDTYVLHFDGSIRGLEVGAPVLFQGAQVGKVTNIVMRADEKELKIDIPVFIEIEPNRIQVVREKQQRIDPAEALQKLIDKGLRAVLTIQSFITGKLLIELDYHPGTPVSLKEVDSDLHEIPTIPSATERLYKGLQEIDFHDLAKKLNNAMAGIDRLVNNQDLAETIRSLRSMTDELRTVIGHFDTNMSSITNEIEMTLSDGRKLINNLDGQVNPLAGDVKKAVNDFNMLVRNVDENLQSLSNELDNSLTGFRSVLSEDAPLIIELEEALEAIGAMAMTIRQLAEQMEQQPEALIKGRREQGGK